MIFEGRDPYSVQVVWTVQYSAAAGTPTDLIVRDSRDTTRVLLVAPRLVQPGPVFPFAGSNNSLNGTVDAATFYDIVQAGAAEMVFLTSPSPKTGGRIPLTPGLVFDWINRAC